MTKNWLLPALLAAVFATTTLAPGSAEAKRLGGGGSAGMQRKLPPRTPDATPAKPAQADAPAPTQAAAPAATGAAAAGAAAPKRSWMGPIAGLAAGLGIAALMSHLGLGEAFGNFLMLALLAVAAVFVIRWMLRRFAGGQPAGQLAMQGAGAAGTAGTPARPWPAAAAAEQPLQRRADEIGAAAPMATGLAPRATAATASVPADFDTAGFERIAKMIFIRLQAANDSGDLNDLREFTTPELFAAIRLDLQERGATTQRTDVLKIDAEVIDVTQENGRQVVSVRFHGLVREESDTAASDFDELWHLTKPDDGSRNWAIAGIQQTA
ncbi:Tim44 domain-containing protein [uncultured Methylibium sp.]|uniref:Tim44 domain-containing protein n=1 Tax=uncultured Methylibium sp. TaxID=381093 RepID=UPI0025E2A968|nr:Tim44-like domain-containing protein [uncultured Methylibium sp.]